MVNTIESTLDNCFEILKYNRPFIYNELICELNEEKSSERKKVKELIADLELIEEELDKNVLLVKEDQFTNKLYKREDVIKPSLAIIINSKRYQLKSIICQLDNSITSKKNYFLHLFE